MGLPLVARHVVADAADQVTTDVPPLRTVSGLAELDQRGCFRARHQCQEGDGMREQESLSHQGISGVAASRARACKIGDDSLCWEGIAAYAIRDKSKFSRT